MDLNKAFTKDFKPDARYGMGDTWPQQPPEQEEEEKGLNRAEKLMGAVFGAAAGLPVAGPVIVKSVLGLEKLSEPGWAARGLGFSYVDSVIDEMRERGIGGTIKSLGSPQKYGDLMEDVFERQAETIGLADEDRKDILERMNKARIWERDRESLFKGEKLISEAILDPLWPVYLAVPPLGIAKVGITAAKLAKAGGTLAPKALVGAATKGRAQVIAADKAKREAKRKATQKQRERKKAARLAKPATVKETLDSLNYWEGNPLTQAQRAGADDAVIDKLQREMLDTGRMAPGITASFKMVYLSPRVLADIPGARGEERLVSMLNLGQADPSELPGLRSKALEYQRRIDENVSEYAQNGFDATKPPMVWVQPSGRVVVAAGSDRISAAARLGIDYIPVQINYHGGSELLDTVVSPNKVAEMVHDDWDVILKQWVADDPPFFPVMPERKRGFGVFPDNQDIIDDITYTNAAKTAAITVGKSAVGKKIGARAVISAVDPAGLLNLADAGDQLAIQVLAYDLFMERSLAILGVQENVVQRIEKGAAFVTQLDDSGHVLYKLADDAGNELDVPLEDFFQFAKTEKYAQYLSNPNKADLVDVVAEWNDSLRDFALREGVDINLLGFADDAEMYFPRIYKKIADLMDAHYAGKASPIGTKPGFTFERYMETVEEAIKTGAIGTGTDTVYPVTRALMIHAVSVVKAVADRRLIKYLETQDISSEIVKNISRDITIKNKRWNIGKSLQQRMQSVITGRALPTQTLISTLRRFDHTIARDFDAATRMVADTPERLVEKQQRLSEIKSLLDDSVEEARLNLEDVKASYDNWSTMPTKIQGKAIHGHPGLGNMVFPPEFADEFTRRMNMRVSGMVFSEKLTKTTNLARAGSLTLDIGGPLIQGLLVLANAPSTWAKALYRSMLVLLDKNARVRWFDQPRIQAISEEFGGRTHMSTEFFEGLRKGEILPKYWGKLERGVASTPLGMIWAAPLKGMAGLFTRAADSFEFFLTVARFEMIDALKYKVDLGDATLDELAQYANKMSGVTSSRALGVQATQREIESTLFALAPRYFRAVTGLLVDATQGGFRGEQARKALARMTAVFTTAYVGIALYLKQPVYLDPRPEAKGGDGHKFMTVTVNGVRVGIGSKPVQIARLLAKIASDPAKTDYYIRRFLRGQAAPITGTSWSIISGETFMGKPIDNAMSFEDPMSFARFGRDVGYYEGLGRFAPFWASAQVLDDWDNLGQSGTGLIGDVIGLRSMPLGAGDRLDDLRDELASLYPIEYDPKTNIGLKKDQRIYLEQEGLAAPNWETLSQRQRLQIINGDPHLPPSIRDRQEDMSRFMERAKNEAKERKFTEASAYYEDKENLRTTWEDMARTNQLAVNSGHINNREFLSRMGDANFLYAQNAEKIFSTEGTHGKYVQELNQKIKEGDKFTPLEDEARAWYIKEIVANPALTDQFGSYRFDAAEERWNFLVKKFGLKTMQDAKRISLNNKDTPLLWRRWNRDRELLREYWEIEDNYLKAHPELRRWYYLLKKAENQRDYDAEAKLSNHPGLKRMKRDLREKRRYLRQTRPRLDATLIYWGYASRPVTVAAEAMIRRM